MSEPDYYDFVVIGGGSAGYAAAATAKLLGLRVAIIEGGEEVGGLCILRGCMPSKTLLESGHRADHIRHAAEFGLEAEYRGANAEAILARKRRLIGEFADYRKQQLETGPYTFLRGWARFTDPHTLEVQLRDGGSQTLLGRTFLIATGSEIRWLEIPGLQETGVLSSDDVLDSDRLPKSVIVLGAGPTGLEFASYYAGLGVEVSVVQRSANLLRGVDEDVSDALAAALTKRGVRLFTKTSLKRLERDGALKRVWFDQREQGECSVEAEEIVYALGRRPASGELGLEHAGVEVSPHGTVTANCCQQTSVSHIFAAGDVCGPYEIVHIAIQQGEIAARNAARLLRGDAGTLEEIDYRLKLFAVFTQPQLAAVGLTVREAADLGLDFVEACYPFDDHGKSMVRGETEGFVKLLAAGPDRKIIGGAVIGPEAAELIHEIVVAMHFGATAKQLASIPHYHPTLSEIWTYPAEALALAPAPGNLKSL
jgi:pyruvate/2-oxoglutarate dehydrogenase complex dihydrolipoamide dehydrogenase (E3) component